MSLNGFWRVPVRQRRPKELFLAPKTDACSRRTLGQRSATHSVEVTPGQILLKGTSTQLDGAVQVTILPEGRPTQWTYFDYLV